MFQTIAAVAVLNSHHEAEEALRQLQFGGFDMQKLSLVHLESDVSLLPPSEKQAACPVTYWRRFGEIGRFVETTLIDTTCLPVTGIGMITVSGPLARILMQQFADGFELDNHTSLGAAMIGLGVPSRVVLDYESLPMQSKTLVIVCGTTMDIECATDSLWDAELTIHQDSASTGVSEFVLPDTWSDRSAPRNMWEEVSHVI